MVHLDAHADAANSISGSLISHGTPMRRLVDEGWVQGANFVQVGLRGYWPEKATFDWMREQGFRWHTIVELEERGVDAVIDDAIAEARDGPEVVYLSVDIDVVDPGMAPGTGTPEPGGPDFTRVHDALLVLARAGARLVAADIVETAPPLDPSGRTEIVAAKLAREILLAFGGREVAT